MKTTTKKLMATLVSAAAIALGANANAGSIFLIGSDAVSFHGDASFINPIMDQMGNNGTKTVLFLNNWGATSTNYTNTNVTFDFQDLSFLTSATNLSPYSAVYVDSPYTCCSDAGSLMTAGGDATLAAFVAAGGSLGIGDYQGHSYWDAALGFSGVPGVINGPDGVLCEDPGVSTLGGLAFGFEASYIEGCFVHQTYSASFFASKGYFALQTTTGGDWVTMASGFTNPDPTAVSEPLSLGLLSLGLMGLAAARRRKI